LAKVQSTLEEYWWISRSNKPLFDKSCRKSSWSSSSSGEGGAMSETINTFSDLLRLLEEHPDWRRQLVKILFPDVDLPKALQELAEAQQRMNLALERLTVTQERLVTDVAGLKTDSAGLKTDTAEVKTDVAGLKTDVSELKTDMAEVKIDVAGLKTDMAEVKTDVAGLKMDMAEVKIDVAGLKTDMAEVKIDVAGLKTDSTGLKTDMREVKHTLGDLKGKYHEQTYHFKAVSIFGRYLRRGRNMTNEVADQLQEAATAGQISTQEFDQVLAADLLWGGQLRQQEGAVILVIEASWLAEISDVERAVARANILRKIGLQALPVVAGQAWTEEAVTAARAQGVVMTTDGQIDEASWQNAW
jgi:uncharacterized coiled-coil DUF342 family protein